MGEFWAHGGRDAYLGAHPSGTSEASGAAAASAGNCTLLSSTSAAMTAVRKSSPCRLADAGIPWKMCGGAVAQFFGLPPDEMPLRPVVANPMWVDDLAAPVIAPSLDIERKSQVAFACIHDGFTKFGLKLNMKPGKTECLLMLRGPKAKELREKCMFMTSPGSRLITHCLAPFSLLSLLNINM